MTSTVITARASARSVGSQPSARIEKVPKTPRSPFRRASGKWVPVHPDFRQDLLRAREIRGDFTFGEEILDIADNTADDWSYNEKTGKLIIQKEAILRSKIRIEARQFHMAPSPAMGRAPTDRCKK